MGLMREANDCPHQEIGKVNGKVLFSFKGSGWHILMGGRLYISSGRNTQWCSLHFNLLITLIRTLN